MKKFLITSLMAAVLVTFVGIKDSFALFGISIEIQRGTNSENCSCCDGGLCYIKISGNALKSIEEADFNEGVVAVYNDHVVLEINKQYSEKFAEDFENGMINLDSDYHIPGKLMREIGYDNSLDIPAGEYKTIRNPETNNFLVILN